MQMPQDDPTLDVQPARRMRRAFSWALLVIALICIINHAIVQARQNQRRQDAPYLRCAAEQQFVAQQIARFAMEARVLERKESIVSLEQKLEEFKEKQARLLNEPDQLSLPNVESRQIAQLFEDAAQPFDDLTVSAQDFINRFNLTVAPGMSEKQREALTVASIEIWVTSDKYGKQMAGAVTAIEKQLESRTAELARIQTGLLGLTLFTLALMALFLFRPLTLMVDRALRAAQASRERAEEESRTRAGFLAKASHEFRTPLNAIIGFERLALGTELTEEQQDYLSSSHRSAEHLLDLVNGILDYSKYESGQFVMDPIPFAVSQVIEDVIELNALDARRRGIQLRFDRAKDVPESVMGDPLFLKQVLINLVRNAIKFTRNGEVTVRAFAVEQNSVRFAVADTGVGIAESEKERIFDAFRQANNTTARPFEGTGLGLTISKQLIERMGSELKLQSTPGQGSTFSFDLVLPAVESTVWKDEPKERPFVLRPATPQFQGTKRVLLAEDNAVNARLTRMQLEELGFECTLVEDGNQAVAALPKGDFDLVLMDLHMPGCDGFEATRRIRDEDQKGCDVAIVALTADLSQDSRRRAFEAGVDDFVTKPVRTEDLERVIDSWVHLDGQRA